MLPKATFNVVESDVCGLEGDVGLLGRLSVFSDVVVDLVVYCYNNFHVRYSACD